MAPDSELLFPRHSKCEECVLHEGVRNPGIGTRAIDGSCAGRDQALLIVGEAPGYREDIQGKSWVGKSGSSSTRGR